MAPARRLDRRSALCALLLGLGIAATAAADFEARVRERLRLYEAARTDPNAIAAALDGRYGELHVRLEGVVPDAQKTAVDHFVLGNFFFAVDPERSLRHHRAAQQRLPDEPAVLLEIAYHHHRAGACAQALPIYERLVAMEWLEPRHYALLAHCRLRAGQPGGALEAWRRTAFRRQHTAVDFTIHDVFGPIAPLARHDLLLRRVRGGDAAAVGPLLDNALRWESDWWNARSHAAALAAARAAIRTHFGPETALGREIEVWASAREAEGAEALRARLTEAKLLLGEDAALPSSSWVARQLMVLAVEHGLAEVRVLGERFEAELERRARGATADADALFLVGVFRAETGTAEALRAIDRYGWQRYGNADFALSLLAGLRREQGAAFGHDHPKLLEALADFPEDPRFARMAFELARAAGVPTTAHLTRLIEAEYHGLRSDRSRYAYALDRWYGALADELERTLPASPAP